MLSAKSFSVLDKIILIATIGIMLYVLKDLLFFEHIDSGGDNYWHHTNAIEVARMMEDGKLLGFYEHGNLGWPMMNVYQPLLYFLEAGIYLISLKSIPITLVHNILELFFITLIPIGVYYLSRKMKLEQPIPGMAALFSILTIAGWGTSFEAFFNLGMATFAVGAALFPFAVGKYYELLHSDSVRAVDYAISTLFIGLAFLGHQLAGYAMFIAFSALTLIRIYELATERGTKLSTKKDTLGLLAKRITIAGIMSLALISFFVFPKFFSFSEYNANDYALQRVTDDAANSFTTQFFVERLVNGEMLDSTNNFGLEKDVDFRWAFNKDKKRPPLVTITFFIGLVICIWNIKDSRYKAIVGLLMAFTVVTLSFDDFPIIRFFPAAKELPYIRLISFLNMIISIIAGVGFTKIATTITNKIVQHTN